MDGQIAQPENPKIIIKAPNNPFNRKIFIYAGVLLLGFFLGLIFSSVLPFGKLLSSPPVAKTTPPAPASKPSIDESKLPISLPLLTNPVVYQWRGDVKGKLTKKDEHNFTLADDQGHSITITDIMATGDKWNTLFFDKSNYKLENRIPLSTIPVGSFLTGEFFIFKGGPNTPVGSMFTKQ